MLSHGVVYNRTRYKRSWIFPLKSFSFSVNMEFKGIALVLFLVAAIAADPHYKPHDVDDLDTYHILEHLFENNGEHAEDIWTCQN